MNSQEFHFDRFHPEQLREIINGSDLEHTILEPGECSARVVRKVTDEFSADSGFYNFPVLVRGQFPPKRLCIGMSMGPEHPTWVNGISIERPSLQVYAEGTEMLYRAGRNTDWMGFSIARQTLQKAALRLRGEELSLPSRGMVELPISVEICKEIFRLIRSSPQEEDSSRLIWIIVEAILSSSSDDGDREPYRFQIVSRADRALRSLVGDKYSSKTLCEMIGVSERSVQIHFREAFGMSPKTWFTKLSLNQARSRLLSAESRPGAVAEIAIEFGFDHLGRFSERYRDLFDELPSETLKRNGTMSE
ncbi:MAG: helix-turn-helix domain-containing protein [Verrucomicrobiales bacterium]|nr:helix-turn-helix domain-containing protein [Verrucomicrobiales bacterium]